MDWDLVLAQVMTGIATGALYFFVASGLTLLWGALDVVNLAHGSFFMIAAFSSTTLIGDYGTGTGYVLSLVLVPLAVAVLGMILEMTLFRRVYKFGVWGQLLISFGLVLVLADLVRTAFGSLPRSVGMPPGFSGFVSVFGVNIGKYQFVVLAMSLLVCLALWLILNRSRVGRLIRAAVDDPGMLGAVGVDVDRLRTLVMGMSAYLAALAGVVAAPRGSVAAGIDVQIVLVAFAVIVIGGLGSVWGALVAALVIGIAEAVSTVFIDRGSGLIVFLVMAVVLVVRPTGLRTIVGREA